MVQPIHHILIANRGEIARRVIRTCRDLGIRTTAVFSEPDAAAPFVQEADQGFALGGQTAAESYLDQERIIAAALELGADAIHPGYGFLSENADFAQRCADAGLIFIGPNPQAIAAMGSKSKAKAIMAEHGVPVIPGYRGTDQSANTLQEEANRIGFPLLLKAAAGGGGKGMRIVHTPAELPEAITGAKREALAAFGDDELLLEKYFPSARHIEFQIFGDRHGNAIHLLERECTIQRRYQKIMEESPSPVMTPALRDAMGQAAVQAARAIGYDNAGTVEFIYVNPQEFYFLEVNTRLQVEHPVTEAITGLDLVAWQIAIAEGQSLPLKQEEVQGQGYALECRLYAEDPGQNFLPATGIVRHWEPRAFAGIRYDSAVESGSEISIFYDPMIAKIIAHGPDRASTLRRMCYALEELACLGVTTNQGFLLRLLQHPAVLEGAYDTHFLQHHPTVGATPELSPTQVQRGLAAALLRQLHNRQQEATLLKDLPVGWRNNFFQPQHVSFQYGTTVFTVSYRNQGDGLLSATLAGNPCTLKLLTADANRVTFTLDAHRYTVVCIQEESQLFIQLPGGKALTLHEVPRFPETAKEMVPGNYESPMPGEVIQVLVDVGDSIQSGQTLVIISSMKMENAIAAAADGVVEAVFVHPGQRIEASVPLLQIAENALEDTSQVLQ